MGNEVNYEIVVDIPFSLVMEGLELARFREAIHRQFLAYQFNVWGVVTVSTAELHVGFTGLYLPHDFKKIRKWVHQNYTLVSSKE